MDVFCVGSRVIVLYAYRAGYRDRGGMMRMADAVHVGVSRRTRHSMRDSGQLEQMARGLYWFPDMPPLAVLVEVAPLNATSQMTI